jgi:hypothetical protein
LDWLTFASSVIGSIAWPVTLVVILFILREPIIQLLPLLRRLKYKELELQFELQVQEVKAAVDAVLPAPPPPAIANPELDRLVDTAGTSPRRAILEAWRMLDRAVEDAAIRTGASPDVTGPAALRHLDAKGLEHVTVSFILKLRDLRNEVAHASAFDVDSAPALNYVGTVRSLIQLLAGFGR